MFLFDVILLIYRVVRVNGKQNDSVGCKSTGTPITVQVQGQALLYVQLKQNAINNHSKFNSRSRSIASV